jgi:hypothetical protein
MDANNDGKIDATDEPELNVRIGYMRFRGGDDRDGNYASGKSKLVTGISAMVKNTGTSYALTYCGSSKGTCYQPSTCSKETCINYNTSPTGGTPLTASLKEAKKYLDAHKAQDPGKDCRKKFVIVVSDGADTYACDGDGQECQRHMYERRREVVAATKALFDLWLQGVCNRFWLGHGQHTCKIRSTGWRIMAERMIAKRTTRVLRTAYSIPRGSGCDTARSFELLYI